MDNGQLIKESLIFVDCLPAAVITGLLASVIYGFVSGERRSKALVFGVFVSYIVLLVNRVWFLRTGREISGFSFVPLSTLTDKAHIIRFILNIIMFVPLGALLPLVFPGLNNAGTVRIALTGLILSITIEAVQGIFMLGHVQTDDVIANVLGAVLGWILYRLYTRAFGLQK